MASVPSLRTSCSGFRRQRASSFESGRLVLAGNTIADNALAGVEVGGGGAVEAEPEGNAIDGNAEAWIEPVRTVNT